MKEINKIRNTKISKIQRERLTWINYKTIEHEEATTGGVLQKKVFLEISQNSQQNTYARVTYLIKLQASGTDVIL